jgi:hypothetical protein
LLRLTATLNAAKVRILSFRKYLLNEQARFASYFQSRFSESYVATPPSPPIRSVASVEATESVPDLDVSDILHENSRQHVESSAFLAAQPTLMRPSAVSISAADSAPVFAIDREDVRRLTQLRFPTIS